MRIVEIKDSYIEFLRNFYPNAILDNKVGRRKHKRKFVGVVLFINSFLYFAPLSSPKESDYDNNHNIRKSTDAILRIVVKNKLIGKILINNMFPVPNSEIIEYNINNEEDLAYRNLIKKEILWIQKNTSFIEKKAKIIYYTKKNEIFRKNEKNEAFLNNIAPFNLLEAKCIEYVENKAFIVN